MICEYCKNTDSKECEKCKHNQSLTDNFIINIAPVLNAEIVDCETKLIIKEKTLLGISKAPINAFITTKDYKNGGITQ